jgi:hypothetical protein
LSTKRWSVPYAVAVFQIELTLIAEAFVIRDGEVVARRGEAADTAYFAQDQRDLRIAADCVRKRGMRLMARAAAIQETVCDDCQSIRFEQALLRGELAIDGESRRPARRP